jgi:hypothetical protein
LKTLDYQAEGKKQVTKDHCYGLNVPTETLVEIYLNCEIVRGRTNWDL